MSGPTRLGDARVSLAMALASRDDKAIAEAIAELENAVREDCLAGRACGCAACITDPCVQCGEVGCQMGGR